MTSRTRRWTLALALAGLGFVVWGAAEGADVVRTFFYQLAWYPLLVAADCALGLRGREPTLLDQPRLAAALLIWSVPIWLLFELANLRLTNWYYVLLPRQLGVRWVGTALAFATVLPALYLAWCWMRRLGVAGRVRGRGFVVRSRHLTALRTLGLVFLVLSLGWPNLFFPLVWGAVTLLLEPANFRVDRSRSLLADLAAGSWSRVLQLLAAGWAVGLTWETLNWFAHARWIYTVPGLERWKLFEMPLPGFLGFPVLALDAFVAYQYLVLAGVAVPGWGGPGRTARPGGARWGRIALLSFATCVFCFAVLMGIDRYTVDSWRSGVERLPGVDSAVATDLHSVGLRSTTDLAGLDADELVRRAGLSRDAASAVAGVAGLANLRGLGADHAAALARAGIADICALARSEEQTVRAAVRSADGRPTVGRAPRIRVWLRAARRACGTNSVSGLLRPGAARIFSPAPRLVAGGRRNHGSGFVP